MFIENSFGSLGEVQNNKDGTYSAIYTTGHTERKVTIIAKASNGVTGSITLTLTPPPDFALDSPVKTQTAKTGESATYIVTVLGTNGFNQTVTLRTGDMPTGVEAKIEPKEVTPTPDEPLQNAQLKLTVSESLAEGEYTFVLLGTSEGMELKELPLTLNVVEKSLIKSFITVKTDPPEGRYMGAMQVSGALVLPDAPADTLIDLDISLSYTSPSDKTKEQIAKTEEKGAYSIEFIPDEVGEWKVVATYSGDEKYTSSSHWDGRNEAGESVASGGYFYRFTAEDFSAVRKMLIVR